MDGVRTTIPNELAPFDGLCSCTDIMDHYQGTIYTIPFKSGLSAAKTIDMGQAEQLLLEYCALGDWSLLFFGDISHIGYSFRDTVEPRWNLSADRTQNFISALPPRNEAEFRVLPYEVCRDIRLYLGGIMLTTSRCICRAEFC